MKKLYDVLRFTLKCILIPAAAILIIYCLNIPYRHIDANKYLDVAKFSTLRAFYTEVQIGNIGSSHGAYNFDYTPLTERGYSCFNFANASQSYNYDYAILKEYGHFLTPGSVLFIPVSYFSFNNEVINASEAQALSVRYYHCLSQENVPDYDPYIDLVTNKFPVLSAGEDILKIFPDLKLSLTVFASENNAEINIEEFAARARDRYSRHFDNKEEYFLDERIADLYDIIDYCKEHEITPVLITTPFSVYYTELISEEFLQEFSETVNNIATDTGVSYYDYSNDERFYDNLIYFSDSDHLNEKGCEYFMQVLLEEVSELSIFP
ncbi:MAG: D-alanyl-lipoteichoic acid biosynthesis protein DltD [Lachnospiraceae bacterium]|nr:D-alanyl-lipoteichoic acid biosynthesis protein DltD [Lachnospiraceae bacterium]